MHSTNIIKAFSLAAIVAVASHSSSFTERSQLVVNHFSAALPSTGSTNPKYLFWYSQARFKAGETAEAIQHYNTALDNLSSNDPPFQLWAAMDTYLRWNHLFTQALKDKTKNKLIGSTEYDYHDTQNKVLMAATARLLAEETWPNETFGSSYSADDPTGKLTLLERMQLYVREGEREHNSPTYFVMHYGSMRSLADFSNDAEIKNKAALTAEWMLASAAAEWLDGHWAASTERIYSPIHALNSYQAGSMLLWLYFGGPNPSGWGDEQSFTVQSAVSSYELPDIILKIAQDRSKPYLHRELHNHPLSGIRKFYSTTYINKNYGVYSQFEQYTSWPSWMNQVQRWGICWKQAAGKSVFFIEDPNDGKQIDVGATPFGQVLQHKDAVIGVYDLPSTQYLKGFVPAGALSVINDAGSSGNVFLHYDSIMIAVHVTNTFPWDGTADFFQRLAQKIGFIVEVSSSSLYLGNTAADRLLAFKQNFVRDWNQRCDTSDMSQEPPILRYRTIDGTLLETKLHSYNKIDNTIVDYDTTTWPLLENPWMQQDYQGRYLKVTFDGQTRVYDFDQWTVGTGLTGAIHGNTGNEEIGAVPNRKFMRFILIDNVRSIPGNLYTIDGRRVKPNQVKKFKMSLSNLYVIDRTH